MFHDWSFVVKYSVFGPLRIKEIHYKNRCNSKPNLMDAELPLNLVVRS